MMKRTRPTATRRSTRPRRTPLSFGKLADLDKNFTEMSEFVDHERAGSADAIRQGFGEAGKTFCIFDQQGQLLLDL